MRRISPLVLPISLVVAALALLAAPGRAQATERPDLHGSGSPLVDVSGRSIKNKRVRAVHTTSPSATDGGTAYFLAKDPYLAYQLGQNINNRLFRPRDGVFGGDISGMTGALPDGTTFAQTRLLGASCGSCHGAPYGTPGSGGNVARISGLGRNVPHYFGAGLLEMLAQQVRDEFYSVVDTNFNDWISVAEAQASPASFTVRPTPGSALVSFGSAQLTGGTTGTPQLDEIFEVWYVDASGFHVPGATQVDGISTLGFNFALKPFGWGEPTGGGVASTLRSLVTLHGDLLLGVQSQDQTSRQDLQGDGIGIESLAGSLQYPALGESPDTASLFDLLGFSREDPDLDGSMNELSEGDLDLVEWYLLNTPPPAFAGTVAEYSAGVTEMDNQGCTVCHIADWDLRARDTIHQGDRRFFDYSTQWIASTLSFRGKLTPLTTLSGGVFNPNRGRYSVKGIFTDLLYHDMGAGFTETDYGGEQQTVWRTTPLWGVGSTGPWGHDGQSYNLRDVILRHDGAGAFAKSAFKAATPTQQQVVLDFLSKLVLYDPARIDCDIDGDSTISTSFMVAGQDTGRERFNPEWLFKVPLQIQGPVLNSKGVMITSFAGVNVDGAYAQTLTKRKDNDNDGWPNEWDAAPFFPGFMDGVQ